MMPGLNSYVDMNIHDTPEKLEAELSRALVPNLAKVAQCMKGVSGATFEMCFTVSKDAYDNFGDMFRFSLSTTLPTCVPIDSGTVRLRISRHLWALGPYGSGLLNAKNEDEATRAERARLNNIPEHLFYGTSPDAKGNWEAKEAFIKHVCSLPQT